ncbi:Transcriptional activator hac1 [Fusarium albosuccineum]|uniref:Transcriptional activator hac1 n=1 Tax=Fusarium albosuccineum TaxID=1237068 RepID=A0A8H4LKV7_9HYPO|nr:Transcriptional activator hac1 [Fusarium albosuccineum]
MAFQQQSPMAKCEHSPAESLLSIPGDPYQSLFATATTPIAAPTMNPMEMMTPQSFNEAMSPGALNTVKEEEPATTPTPEPEKRTTKKRKSWGQVLPQPKTNLPPRKRAKTEDEKEQRRVERVLRNRRAAQSSRERKRLEVEALEQRNKELEAILVESQKTNMMLAAELDRYRRSSGIVTRSTSPLDSLRENPVTLSQELFSSQDPRKAMDEILRTSPHATVNPASLSPSLTPVDDSSEAVPKQEPSMEANTSEQTSSNSPVSTQHPAAMLTDLPSSDDAAFSLGDSFVLPTALDADRCVLESGLLASPNSSVVSDDYLACDAPAFNLDDDFDISQFLHEDGNHVTESLAASDFAAANHGHEPKYYDLETQISSENPILQPQPGASSFGCDAGSVAVGF